MSDTDIRGLVQHHDKQLNSLDTRMSHVETTLKDHGGVLNVIRDAVTKQDAQPKFEARTLLGVVKDFGVIFAMVCGGILYLASRQSETEVALIKEKQTTTVDRLERVESLILPERWATRETHK